MLDYASENGKEVVRLVERALKKNRFGGLMELMKSLTRIMCSPGRIYSKG
jgi:hypothetical protein